MAFKYRLYLPNGEDIGTFTTAVPDWDVGMDFRAGDGNTYRIVNLVPELDVEGSDYHGLFVVTPIELALRAGCLGIR